MRRNQITTYFLKTTNSITTFYSICKIGIKIRNWKLEFNLVLSIYAAKINTDHNASIQCAKVIEIVRCFLNIVSKIRQICIISARFCGWKFALVAQIDMNSQSELMNEFLLLFWYFSVSQCLTWDQNKTLNMLCYKMYISHS